MAVEVIKVGPLGPYSNNAYVIVDRATMQAVFVDAPMESARAVEQARGMDVQAIAVTHRHPDHWANIDLVKAQLGAPVWCHDADKEPYKAKVSDTIGDGQEIALGDAAVRVIHTPGHTPGSICLLVESGEGPALMSGDTLFPGGPGRSDSAASLQQMIASIRGKLFVLPEETRVYPGHGDNTTIGEAKREYAVFAAKEHPADLCGDVTWEG